MACRRFDSFFSKSAIVLTVAAVLLLAARPSAGQAFIPAAGDVTVSASFQSVSTSGQLNSSGVELFPDSTDSQASIWHVEYGLTDRIAVHAALPLMMVRYEGPNPHPVGRDLQPSDIDDGSYHGSFQDFYFGARYGVVQTPHFALAPFVEVVIPSHHYESLGQAVVGRDLRVLLVGAAVGGFLDDVLPGLHFQTRVSYAIAQDVLDIQTNRSGIDSALGYFVTPRVAVQFIETFNYIHDGMDFIGPDATPVLTNGATPTLEHYLNHDRLIRSRVLSLGGGLTYALNDSLSVFASATTMAWGRNVQRPVRALTAGMSWSFHTRGSASVPNPNVNRRVALE
jgi:hypothetical protein